MRIWIARNEGYYEDELRVTGELMVFYDTPILKYDSKKRRRCWTCARVMCQAPSYMFPEIEEEKCVMFLSEDVVLKLI